MKTYNNLEEVKKDIVNRVLKVDDNIEINFDCFEIDADIICRNIYSKGYKRNITAGNITARNITAGNITARNINAWNINAGDISYWAVCSSYGDIKCKSIKGRRENAKHFCLDGDITLESDDKTEEAINLLKEKEALLTQLEEIEDLVEGMKREKVSGGFDGECEMNIEIATYNEALSDLLTALKKKKDKLDKEI